MRINSIQNYNYNQSFGTVYGVGLAEKLILAKEKKFLAGEHLRNIEKIENDGKNLILDLVDKHKIVTRNSGKGVFKTFKYLTLSDLSGKEVIISDMSHLYTQVSNNRQIFHVNRFLDIFSDNYDLENKIQQASLSLEV